MLLLDHALTAQIVLLAVVVTGFSGVPGLFFPRHSRAGERLSAGLLAAGCLVGLCGALLSFRPGAAPTLDWAWPVPGGALALRVDGLSALFLLPIFAISFLGSTYGLEYWRHADHPKSGRRLRLFWGGLTAALAIVVTADNTILFLAGWEVMALCNYLALTVEDRDPDVRRSGFLFLVAAHVSILALFAAFALLSGATHGFAWSPLDDRMASGGAGTALFLLALIGFGTKAGVMPFHFWLPSAHANAPSHVSALMSGVVIKMGIYGLARIASLVPHPPVWWGGTILALGVLSGVLGVAFALGQHDLKRLLAYHSVENIGIICIGLGLALLGRSAGRPELIALGLAGALFHVWNHGLFKSLLFFSAGSTVHATGTREMDLLGGLAPRMPSTALLFLIGAAAICGLPPLNGFASELLIYLGLFRSALRDSGDLWLAGALGAPALALIGALAVACFAKAFGVVFLGRERTGHAARARESGPTMLAPMGVLAALCVFLGVAPPLAAPLLDRAAVAWSPSARFAPVRTLAPLDAVGLGSVALLLGLAALGAWLYLRTRARARSPVPTWDCGYPAGTARIQYTGSSFAAALVDLFRWVLRPRVHAPSVTSEFPASSAFHSETPDAVLDLALVPAVDATGRAFVWLRWIQGGSVQAYLFYVLITLILLLLWR